MYKALAPWPLEYAVLLVPLRSVQFSSVQFKLLDFIGYYFISPIIIFKVEAPIQSSDQFSELPYPLIGSINNLDTY